MQNILSDISGDVNDQSFAANQAALTQIIHTIQDGAGDPQTTPVSAPDAISELDSLSAADFLSPARVAAANAVNPALLQAVLAGPQSPANWAAYAQALQAFQNAAVGAGK